MSERYGKENSTPRNGKGRKTVQRTVGHHSIKTSRDCERSDPHLAKKRHVHLAEMEEKILMLHAKGLCTRDIESALQDLYGVTISQALIADITDAGLDEALAWKTRPLAAVYPIVWLGGIVIKVRYDKQMVNQSAHVVLGVNLRGEKEVLGLWLAEHDDVKPWLAVLTELCQRGVQDIYVACMDGLKGALEAVNAVYPKTLTQLCMVHLVRASLRNVTSNDSKAVVAALKCIYQSATAEDAARELEAFESAWGAQYNAVARLWRGHWDNIIPFFQFLPEIRKVIYTTNAIKSLNMVMRKYASTWHDFPNDDVALKTLLLAVREAAKNLKAINHPARQDSCHYFL